MTEGLLRVPLSKEERKTMTELGKKPSYEKIFMKEFGKWDQNCNRKRVPHCATCVFKAWEKKKAEVREYLRDAMDSPSIEKREDLLDPRKCIHFNNYEKSYMSLSETEPETIKTIKKIIDGTVVNVPIKFANYKCNKFGHGVSMEQEDKFVPRVETKVQSKSSKK